MENYEVELDFEVKQLKHVISIAEKQLSAIQQSNRRQLSDVIDAKKELRENTSHSIYGLWSSERFHELASLSQYVNPVFSKISTLEVEANKMLALERMIQSPYFARIDFQFEDEEEVKKIYIGRTSLMDEKDGEIYVYDWRSPLASVFYRFGVGKAFYDAPCGKISGEVSLKRQFEIRCGVLEYFFDADVQIIDEFLRKLLSQNASSKMKTIVETIQKDQDIVIRDMKNDLMMVQGIAGSGKTSVALHRAAYLMYQGLSTKLSSQNIMIISPNTLFEQYISNVLPELGEDNVISVNFEEMFKNMISCTQIETRHQLLENLITCQEKDRSSLMKKSVEFKTSNQFKIILDRFIEDIPRKWIEFSDVEYDGKCIFSRSLLKTEVLNKRRNIPLGLRLGQLEESIFEKVHGMRKIRMKKLRTFVKQYKEHTFEVEEFARLLSISESTVLAQTIHSFTKLNILSLYKKLFSDLKYFKCLAKGIQLPDDIDDILKLTQERLEGEKLPYEDGLALVFLQLKLYGFRSGKSIKQVVIDEAQDYYPLHFEIVKILFPQARFTILGDIYQTIEKSEDSAFYDKINKILDVKKSTLITMNKSFRCTSEILNFSRRFLQQNSEIESFSRKGEEPKVYGANNQDELNELIIKEIQFCKEEKYQSIGLLCKTEKDAEALYSSLKAHLDICLINSHTVTDIKGIFILPLYMAKGLEFDAVLLCDTDKEHYSTEDDKKLLYIGCTRALHRLSLFYTGEMSTLLD
nr:3'-5' exonuclease [Sedimentibacter sp.]